MEMTLARALRYQKRVKEQISKVEGEIVTSNSVIEGTEREIVGTIADAMKRREDLVNHLMTLKLTSMKATQPIQAAILRLSEIKGKIAFLNRINVTNGPVVDRYGRGDGAAVKYTAEIRKLDRDKLVVELQAEIDELQGRVDAHNANTKITIADLPGLTPAAA